MFESLLPQALDDKDVWYRLGSEALRQGNHAITEFAYQKTKSYERLSFLYTLSEWLAHVFSCICVLACVTAFGCAGCRATRAPMLYAATCKNTIVAVGSGCSLVLAWCCSCWAHGC